MMMDHIVVRRLVLSLLVISLMYSLYKRLSDNDQEKSYRTVPKTLVLYTEENLKELKLLAEKTPKKKRKLLLAVLGSVFDVSKGKQHYDPEDGAYGVFAFRDATRAFVTGDFQNDLNDDCRDFNAEQYAQAVRWRDFYMKSKVGWFCFFASCGFSDVYLVDFVSSVGTAEYIAEAISFLNAEILFGGSNYWTIL